MPKRKRKHNQTPAALLAKQRWAKVSPAERSAFARKVAKARWDKPKRKAS